MNRREGTAEKTRITCFKAKFPCSAGHAGAIFRPRGSFPSGGISGARDRHAQASALVGVAPLNHDSGQLRSPPHIHGGRAAVRRVLYMALAALATIRPNPILHTLYQRLLARGKLPKVALTAGMRKLTHLLNRLIKNPNFCFVQ